jgi:hypothetical protein
MGSGAYSVFIDQQAGTGMSGTPVFQRVVPLPPPDQSGAVKFTDVWLSLAYDTFGDPNAPLTIPAIVRVLKSNAPVDQFNFTVEVGRQGVARFHTGDLAVSVQLNPPGGFHPQVTALVEYGTP